MKNPDDNRPLPYSDKPAPLRRVADLEDSDKPREKALSQGIAALTNTELMAIILGSGLPGKSVIDLSREILRDCDGRISRVARCSIHQLSSKYAGIGPAKAVSLAAAFELGHRTQSDMRLNDTRVTGSESVYDYMRGDLELLNHEEFWVLHLDRGNHIIYRERISMGGTAATVVDVKIVMKSAVDKLSAALIVVHNHPSGTLTPSSQDDQLTKRIKNAAELLDMRLLDHIIISSKGYFSYADHGRM